MAAIEPITQITGQLPSIQHGSSPIRQEPAAKRD